MAEEPEEKEPAPEPAPSVLEDLVDRTRAFLRETAADYVKRPLDDLLRWILGRTLLYVLAAVLFATAVVFLMIAGVEAFRLTGMTDSLVYLVVGTVGILAGLLLLSLTRASRKP